MNLNEVTAEIRESAKSAKISGKTVKLALDIGVVYLDLRKSPAVVSNDDHPADATVTTSLATLENLSNKKTNPMMAIISGKVKIEGDVAAAMQLQSIL